MPAPNPCQLPACMGRAHWRADCSLADGSSSSFRRLAALAAHIQALAGTGTRHKQGFPSLPNLPTSSLAGLRQLTTSWLVAQAVTQAVTLCPQRSRLVVSLCEGSKLC